MSASNEIIEAHQEYKSSSSDNVVVKSSEVQDIINLMKDDFDLNDQSENDKNEAEIYENEETTSQKSDNSCDLNNAILNSSDIVNRNSDENNETTTIPDSALSSNNINKELENDQGYFSSQTDTYSVSNKQQQEPQQQNLDNTITPDTEKADFQIKIAKNTKTEFEENEKKNDLNQTDNDQRDVELQDEESDEGAEENNEDNIDEDEDYDLEENDSEYFKDGGEEGNESNKRIKELNEFIDKAKDFGANALDLSRKNLKKIPIKLFKLRDLQYIYLEGNSITELPKIFFLKFPQLKWLDLRNNNIKELPTAGLESHNFLRYLLLENNKIKKLPHEIANIRHLTALNLIDNPIEYPPMEIVQKGCKWVQEFLKNDCSNFLVSRKNSKTNLKGFDETTSSFNAIRSVTDDIWASDEEDARTSTNTIGSANRFKSIRSNSFKHESFSFLKDCDARIQSATRNILIARSLRPGESENPNYDLKERLNKAKLNANRISKSASKLLHKRNSMTGPSEKSLFRDKDYDDAIRNNKIENYKKKKEKIDAKLQKVNDKIVTDEFKNELRAQQRKLLNKRLIKGVDYGDAALNAPFDINEEHLTIMTNEQRAILDKKLANQRMRPLSPDTLWRIEEERRQRDHELQEKIREYTNKLLNSRNSKNLNPKMDKLQAAKDIRELKKIEQELNQRRMELQFNVNPTIGNGLKYRETAKLNTKATISNVVINKKYSSD